MTLTNVLLLAILVSLLAGFGVLFLILDQHLSSFRHELGRLHTYLGHLLGDPCDGRTDKLFTQLDELLRAIDRGKIPSLRRDDWVPGADDLDRIHSAEERRVSAELYLRR